MENMMIWIILGLLILFAIIAVVAVKKRGKRPTDYYSMFVMGAIWFPFGILFWWLAPEIAIGRIFFVLGLMYVVVGWVHKKDWKKNHKTWKQLDKTERNVKALVMFLLGVLALLGLVFFILGG